MRLLLSNLSLYHVTWAPLFGDRKDQFLAFRRVTNDVPGHHSVLKDVPGHRCGQTVNISKGRIF